MIINKHTKNTPNKIRTSCMTFWYWNSNLLQATYYKAVVEDFAIFGDPEVEDDDEETIEPFAESDF